MAAQDGLAARRPSALRVGRRERRPLRMSRARILQIGKFYPPHMGGIETHLEALCGELRETFDVRVVAANHEAGSGSEVRAGIPVERVATVFSLGNAPVNPGLVRATYGAAPELTHLRLLQPGGVPPLRAS